ncbi:hypothetical protein GCM10011499_35800 [Pelagibacterium lentulum]|uniref:Uncharacterized protein n=1 Tax=Pelagibacterium lentulum TaxID=2029865 RepID=A0A916RN13_9HYPH|nr:hypothetical protein GCM10011499_35800 [Pelagibacterium lentulum]
MPNVGLSDTTARIGQSAPGPEIDGSVSSQYSRLSSRRKELCGRQLLDRIIGCVIKGVQDDARASVD